ncbi:MAG: prolyl-tRNA synthetase associated domain-containing protein [Lachnospiraceae bacterium]|nr:prolyl-tRNA synthetase associated domain-containing protein [Lachnospiraceae bacterium]
MSTYQIFHGRPVQTDGRKEKELRVYELLDELGISYDRIDHEEMNTIEACHGVDEALGIHICKNLFLCNRQQTQFYLLLLPGEKKFRTKDLSAQIGSARLSFAGAEAMERFLDITPGSVSVMGLMNDREQRVQLLIDRDLLKEEWFGCHPCMNTSSIRMRLADMLKLFLPAVKHEAIYVNLPDEKETE